MLDKIAGVISDRERAMRKVADLVLPTLYRPLLPCLYVYGRDYSRDTSLFVDCGANTGGGFQYFSNIFPVETFTYHFFEPNPNCVEQLETSLASSAGAPRYEIFRKAVWVREETLHFFGIHETGDPTTEGGSVVRDHNSSDYALDDAHALSVQGTDFLEYLVDVQNRFDHIFVKMDIESAELDVLEYLWENKEKLRKKLVFFVEFHSIYSEGESRKTAKAREREILKNTPDNVTLYQWI